MNTVERDRERYIYLVEVVGNDHFENTRKQINAM